MQDMAVSCVIFIFSVHFNMLLVDIIHNIKYKLIVTYVSCSEFFSTILSRYAFLYIFRKFEIYSMAWQNEINMENVSVAVGQYGGPIAIIRDRKKFVKVQGIGKPIISIYSASGKNISSTVWSSGQIIQLGWSSTEDLLCIQDDGSVLIYDMFGSYQHTFSMGQVCVK